MLGGGAKFSEGPWMLNLVARRRYSLRVKRNHLPTFDNDLSVKRYCSTSVNTFLGSSSSKSGIFGSS